MKISPDFGGEKTKPIAGLWPEIRSTKLEIRNEWVPSRPKDRIGEIRLETRPAQSGTLGHHVAFGLKSGPKKPACCLSNCGSRFARVSRIALSASLSSYFGFN